MTNFILRPWEDVHHLQRKWSSKRVFFRIFDSKMCSRPGNSFGDDIPWVNFIDLKKKGEICPFCWPKRQLHQFFWGWTKRWGRGRSIRIQSHFFLPKNLCLNYWFHHKMGLVVVFLRPLFSCHMSGHGESVSKVRWFGGEMIDSCWWRKRFHSRVGKEAHKR